MFLRGSPERKGYRLQVREGKGYIAVPACGGNLAEAKRACNQTSLNYKNTRFRCRFTWGDMGGLCGSAWGEQ
eukprot:604085-Pelagomonas_calceolata.AAC.1